MKLTLTQAAKECGRAKATLSKAIKTGRMTAEKQKDGSYAIDTSELFRVYPKKSKPTQVTDSKPQTNNNKNSDIESLVKIGKLEAENEMLKLRLEEALKEKEDWKEQTKRQTLLLEHKSEEKIKKKYWLFG